MLVICIWLWFRKCLMAPEILFAGKSLLRVLRQMCCCLSLGNGWARWIE